jgi:tetratricopeptide (TPR) repeat protein
MAYTDRPLETGKYAAASAGGVSVPAMKPAGSASLLVLVFTLAGVLLLVFTRLDYSFDAYQQYLTEENLSPIMPPLASAGAMLSDNQRYTLTLEHIQSMKRAEPQRGDLHYYAGICYLRTNRPGEAMQAFERAAELGPPEIHSKADFFLGIALAKAGQPRQAQAVQRYYSVFGETYPEQ